MEGRITQYSRISGWVEVELGDCRISPGRESLEREKSAKTRWECEMAPKEEATEIACHRIGPSDPYALRMVLSPETVMVGTRSKSPIRGLKAVLGGRIGDFPPSYGEVLDRDGGR